jgi:hypothetical protein
LTILFNLADFWLKDGAIIIRPLVIISASSDSNLMNKGSLDSSHQDEMNGGQFMSIGSIDVKIDIKS